MTAPLVSTTDRPYQLLPPLTVDQRDLLRQSILENGVLEPVVFDEDGEILDGHHRVEIAEELGIEYPRRVIDDLDRPGKNMYALTVNVARRQLDQSVRGGLVAQMRIRGMSIRQIAKAVGVDPKTVRNDLAQVGNPSPPDKVTGSDGKSYAASRPAPGPVVVAETAAKTPEPVAVSPSPATGSGSPSPEPEPPAKSVRHLSPAPSPAVKPTGNADLEAELAADSTRRASIRNLTSVLTFLNPVAIAPAELAEREYAPVLDEFDLADLERAADTLNALVALKRGVR